MTEAWPVLLMVRELGLGGTERQLCEMARSLDREQFQPHVACFHAQGFRARELAVAGIPILELPVRSFHSWSAVTGARRLAAYIRRHRIRVVHTFDVPLNLFGVPLARALGVPLVLSSQRAHRDLTPGLIRHLLRMTDLLADGIVVNSLAVRQQLLERDRVPRQRIHLCPNGIDTRRFQPGPRCRTAALSEATLVVGVVCAFRPEKDLPTLLEAFARVRRLRPGLKLALVGDGPSRDAVCARAEALGLWPDCHCQSATADVPVWLRAMDIFVLPSLSESLSNSLMEAMACGCAVVASRAGGNPELVTHERTGLLFRPGDAAELAACLQRLVEDDELRQRLAEAAALRMAQEFSLEAAAARLGRVYLSLI